jgi:hypothetical protein
MNMFRAVQLNEFSIRMKLTFQTGKVATREKLWCGIGDDAWSDDS